MAPPTSIKKKSSKKSISDKISEFLVPKQLHDPEIDSEDETTARNFNEDDDDDDNELRRNSTGKNISLSEIRKKNVKLLNDADEKYRGKVATRKDFHNSDDEGVSADDFENSSEDEADVKEFSMKLKQFDSGDSDDDGDDDEGSGNEDEDDEESDSGEGKEDNDMDDNDSDDDGDDDNDEDEDEDSMLDDDGTNSDESDFNDGDILPQSTKTEQSPTTLAAPSIKPSNINVEIEKGICVQNQLQIWEKLLEIRINSQKLLTKANSLPNFEQMNKYQENNDDFALTMQKTSKNLENLFEKMCEMQHQMISQYSETKNLPLASRRKRKLTNNDGNDEHEKRNKRINTFTNELQDSYCGYRDYRNSVLLKWYDRTKILNPGSKDSKFTNSMNILQNIDGAMSNRDELLKKTQLHKGGYQIIGYKNNKLDENNKNNKNTDENQPNPLVESQENIYSAEIYDDTDFYHTQLRELIEFKANTSTNSTEMTKQFMELQKLRKKMKKVVDTRASKGRKIRYVVHNKMVNFMAKHDPTEWTNDAKNELYSSLFGGRIESSVGELSSVTV